MQSTKTKNSRGFTLIELIVIIALLGILTSIAIPRYVSSVSDSRVRVCKSNRSTIARSYMYFVQSGNVPVDLTNQTLEEYLISHNIINGNFSACPSGGTITWTFGSDGFITGGTCSIESHNLDTGSTSSVVSNLLYDFSTFNATKLNELKDSKDFIVKSGTWSVNATTGMLVQSTSGVVLIKNPKGSEDYTITVNAALSSGSSYGGYGINFDTIEDPVTKLDKGYIFQFDRGLAKYVIRPRTGLYTGGGENSPVTLQSSVNPPNPSTNPTWWAQDHEVTLTVTNVSPTQRMVQAFIDGGTTPIAVYTYADTIGVNEITYTGFRTWNGVAADFNSIEIK